MATITIPQQLPGLRQLLREAWQRLKGAIKPLLVLIIIGWIPGVSFLLLFELLSSDPAAPSAMTISLMAALVLVAVGLQVIVTTGQLYVLNTTPPPLVSAALRHGLRRGAQYVGHGIALTGLALATLLVIAAPFLVVTARAGVPTGLSGLTSGSIVAALIASVLLVFLAIYIFLRLAFVMPLAALGEGGGTFRASWQLTSGYAWGIFWRLAVLGILTLLATGLSQGILTLSTGDQNSIGSILGTIGMLLIQTVSGLFITTALIVLLNHLQRRPLVPPATPQPHLPAPT